MLVDPSAREREVIGLLDEWPWESESILIGGYAAAAYGPARYSDDIDFVISKKSRKRIEEWLTGRGFVTATPGRRSRGQMFENAHRLVRRRVTVDLLVGFVRDREAGVDIPSEWVLLRPHRVRLDLLSGRVSVPSRVARPEAIWALKLQSGRDQDLTDLFSIAKEPMDSTEVVSLFRTLMSPSFHDKLQRVSRKLDAEKIYADARSRLGLKDSPGVRQQWERFRDRVASCVPAND